MSSQSGHKFGTMRDIDTTVTLIMHALSLNRSGKTATQIPTMYEHNMHYEMLLQRSRTDTSPRQRRKPHYTLNNNLQGKGKGHPITGHLGSEGEQRYSSTLPSTSVLDGCEWSTPRPGRFNPGKDPVPNVEETGWAPGQVWTGAENLDPAGIQSPDLPARSESLYRLSYPGRLNHCIFFYLSHPLQHVSA